MGNIHETAGAITAAKRMYEEVLKWEPTNMTAKNSLQLLESSKGQSGSFLKDLFRKFTKK